MIRFATIGGAKRKPTLKTKYNKGSKACGFNYQ